MKLHHVGIVVKNIQESLGELTKFLDFQETSVPIEVKSQRVNVCFLKTSDVYVELIEPIENNSPVKNFSDLGGGFHHLCFEVENIFEEIEKMKKKGARVFVEPTKGFEDRFIKFVLLNMKITICNLIEFVVQK